MNSCTYNNEILKVKKEYKLLQKKMMSLCDLIQKVNSAENFEQTFEYVFYNFKQFIPYNRLGMATINEKDGTISAEIAKSTQKDIYLKNGYCLLLRDTSLTQVLENGQPRIINDLEEYFKEHPNSESTQLIIKEGMRSSLTLPLKLDDSIIGVMFFSSMRKNAYDDSHIMFLNNIANHISNSFGKSILVDNLVMESVMAVVRLVESRDDDTGTHIDRMRNYATAIARELVKTPKYEDIITERFIRDVYNFSPLHDIGKVGIRDNILLKPGKLTQEEFEIMKTHTIIGGQTLKNAQESLKNKRFFNMGIDIALCHHEKYNGKGYPYGLAGDDIPLAARIVSIADVFDALTSKRPYKPAFSIEKSMEIIYNERGESFDPDILDAFLNCKENIIAIHKRLSEN